VIPSNYLPSTQVGEVARARSLGISALSLFFLIVAFVTFSLGAALVKNWQLLEFL
jgi:hypothetical protein